MKIAVIATVAWFGTLFPIGMFLGRRLSSQSLPLPTDEKAELDVQA